jgi:hypothetical protein
VTGCHASATAHVWEEHLGLRLVSHAFLAPQASQLPGELSTGFQSEFCLARAFGLCGSGSYPPRVCRSFIDTGASCDGPRRADRTADGGIGHRLGKDGTAETATCGAMKLAALRHASNRRLCLSLRAAAFLSGLGLRMPSTFTQEQVLESKEAALFWALLRLLRLLEVKRLPQL